MWSENEESVIESLLLRTKGLLIHTNAPAKDVVSLLDSKGIERKMVNGWFRDSIHINHRDIEKINVK